MKLLSIALLHLLVSPLPAQDAGEVEALLKCADAHDDDWETEVWHSATSRQFGLLSALLVEDASPAAEALEPLFAEGFSAEPPRPGLPREWRHRGLAVQRYRPAPLEGEILEPVRDPAAFFAQLLAPLEEASERRFEFKEVAVHPGPEGYFGSEVHFQAFGRPGAGALQLNGRLSIGWELDPEGGDPRIASLEFQELTQVAADAPLYEERTRAVLADAGGASELLAAGCEVWNGRTDRLGEPNFWGHNGIAVADVNGDELDDLYVAMGTGVPNMLFVQNPDGTAAERALEAGCAWLDDTKGVLLADFDNDGDPDLLCAVGPTLVLSENDGVGNFTPLRSLRAATNAAFYGLSAADYDLDGDLDVYAVRYVKTSYADSIPIPYHDARNGPRNHLLRNDGMKFVDVTDLVGLGEQNDRFSLVGVWTDYDLDGDPDLYVANDFGRNNLYRNDGGSFVDVAAQAGVEDQAAGMGVSFADIDLDGREDLLVSNMFSSAGQRISYQPRFKEGDEELRRQIQYASLGNSLFRNQGDGTFEDQSDDAGIRLGRWSWGSVFTDIDGDGLPDMLVPNGFLTNERDDDL